MRKFLTSIAAILSMAATFNVPSFTLSGGGTLLLPQANDVRANWQNAGLAVIGGIPNRTTVCATVTPTGLTPPAANDDAAKINAAISSCAAGSVLMLAAGTFQIDQSEYIALNKSITIRGTGTCTNAASPYCPTVITVHNGAIEDWEIGAGTAGAKCGVAPSSASGCTEAAAVILVSPSVIYNWGWAGCFLGTTPTNCGSALTADAAQGDTTIQVASTSKFSVGMWVLIDENPKMVTTTNPTGGGSIQASSDFLSASSSPATMRVTGGDIPAAYSFSPNRVNSELHLITAIGTNTLTFDSPLTMAFRQSGSHDARVYWPTVQGPTANPFLQQAGVENLTITRPGNGGVGFTFCAYCWVKGVEVATWIAGAVNVNYSARVQIEHNYFHNGADLENNGVEYPVGISSASTENLLTDNIITFGGKGMVGRAAGTNVVSYNYVDKTMYMQAVIGDYWVDMGLNGSHYAGAHHWLLEGNWADNCDSDETHGNAIYHTFFRNWCTGLRTDFTDPSINKLVSDTNGIAYANNAPNAPGPRRAAGPMAFDYWFAYLGNVLGTPGVTTAANGWVYDCPGGNKCIWMSGWVGSEWPGPDKNLKSAVSPNFIFRSGNYDYVTNTVDSTAGFLQTLPSSLYLSSAPSVFATGLCGYAWPWVTPTGSPQVQANGCGNSGLPAKARYDAGTPFVQP